MVDWSRSYDMIISSNLLCKTNKKSLVEVSLVDFRI